MSSNCANCKILHGGEICELSRFLQVSCAAGGSDR